MEILNAKAELVAPEREYERVKKDSHYNTLHQPLETMQANMSNEAFCGYLRGNIIKYACRMDKKGMPEEDARKIANYSRWLALAIKGETVNPRVD